MSTSTSLQPSPIEVTELLNPGELSHHEQLRGYALKIQNGTVTDKELIEFFLDERGQKSTTRANYEAQLRRLQCFCIEVAGITDPRSENPLRPGSNIRAGMSGCGATRCISTTRSPNATPAVIIS